MPSPCPQEPVLLTTSLQRPSRRGLQAIKRDLTTPSDPRVRPTVAGSHPLPRVHQDRVQSQLGKSIQEKISRRRPQINQYPENLGLEGTEGRARLPWPRLSSPSWLHGGLFQTLNTNTRGPLAKTWWCASQSFQKWSSARQKTLAEPLFAMGSLTLLGGRCHRSPSGVPRGAQARGSAATRHFQVFFHDKEKKKKEKKRSGISRPLSPPPDDARCPDRAPDGDEG